MAGRLKQTAYSGSSFSQAGRVGVLEDFRILWLESDTGRRRLFRADNGHAAELAAFVEAVRTGGPMPIPPESLLSTTLTSLAAVESIRSHSRIDLAAS